MFLIVNQVAQTDDELLFYKNNQHVVQHEKSGKVSKMNRMVDQLAVGQLVGSVVMCFIKYFGQMVDNLVCSC